MLQKLRNLRKKWRCEATKQRKLAYLFFEQNSFGSGSKSVGMYIGLENAALDVEKIIERLESYHE